MTLFMDCPPTRFSYFFLLAVPVTSIMQCVIVWTDCGPHQCHSPLCVRHNNSCVTVKVSTYLFKLFNNGLKVYFQFQIYRTHKSVIKVLTDTLAKFWLVCIYK